MELTIEQKIAVRYYKDAETGNSSSQCMIGLMYETGESSGGMMAKNISTAIEWHLKAAEQGEAESMCSLGLIYAKGKEITKDETKAINFLQKALESNDSFCHKDEAEETLKLLLAQQDV